MQVNCVTKFNIPPELLKQQAAQALERGVKDALEVILQEANEKVPLDQSTLLRSGNTDYERTNEEVKGSVYYDTPYAVRLHEHPEYNFQRGRQGKWLEDTVNQRGADILESSLQNVLNNQFGG